MMSEREKALQTLLDNPELAEIKQDVQEMKNMFSFLLDYFIVQQKDACEAAGVSPDTVRNKVLSGEVEILHAQGSRLNYLTIKSAGNLKKRKPIRRRRG